MTKTLLTILLASGVALCSAQNKPTSSSNAPALKSSNDSASYALGLSVAEDLKSRGVKSVNVTLLGRAMQDAFAGNSPLLSTEQRQKAIYGFLEAASKNQHAAAMDAGKASLDQNSKKAGVITLPSGLQYEVLKKGTGAKPKASNQVTVHYKGTLLDGKQFDSSYDRNQPLEIQLDQVIAGWTEGVQLMPVGSKYRFYIPYQLGYGENGAGPDIPPYSVLIFEIELLEIGK